MFQNRNDIDEHPDFDMFYMEDCHILRVSVNAKNPEI
jgi:hypothetical protein